MPERVLLQPSPLEYGLHRAQYDALVDELEGQGVLVRPVEGRSFPESDGKFYDLVIHVGEVAGAIVGTAHLIRIIRGRLCGRQAHAMPRCAKLFLYDGEEHEFSLDEDGVAAT